MLTNTVARKIMVSVTGLFMILYVIAHVIGNYTLFGSAVNAYAEGLREWPYLIVLWASRMLLFVSFLLHIYYSVLLKLENRRAKPAAYAVTKYRTASFAGRTMIWSGSVVGIFVIYHLLHFTFQVTDPAVSAIRHPDALGRPDVFSMIVKSFSRPGIALLYIIGVLSLGLHLYHGIESSIQSLGLNNEQTLPVVVKTGMIMAVILFIAYAAIPATILAGLVR